MEILYVTPQTGLQNILNKIVKPTTIYMKKGVYREKIVISADNVKLVGEDRQNTKIVWGDYAKKAHFDGKEFNTFRTYTVCVTGENAVIENLTVENDAGAPEMKGQSVALSVHAKRFYAKNVDLVSTQDTLFCAPFPDDLVARYSGLTPDPASGENYYEGFIPERQLKVEGGCVHLFEGCRICGNTDFVFGGAEAYFYCCDIVSVKDARGTGFVCAPCHPLREGRGFAFLDCNFVNGGAEENSVYLARPWRDFGKCVFVNCKLGGHVRRELFDRWRESYRDKTARFGYYNLQGIEVTPVSWATRLTPLEASEIINTFTARKKEFVEK